MNSRFALSFLIGLSVCGTTQGTTVADLGFDEIALTAAKDIVYEQTEMDSSRTLVSLSGQGIVVFDHRGFKQRRQMVARSRRSPFMSFRPL